MKIAGGIETKGYTAILQKLGSEKDDTGANHLVQVTKSSLPRLTIIDEKLFVAEIKVAAIAIVQRNDNCGDVGK